MGIPRLLHHMTDFGATVELGTAWKTHVTRSPTQASSADDSPTKVVIDGPSLAYYAYSRAVAGRYRARNAFEAMPSYSEVTAIVTEFLSALKSHGLDIQAIFFDGALPEAKRSTRLSRLQSYLDQLQDFKSLNLTGVHSIRPAVDTDVFTSPTAVSAKLKDLPASPFLVPAVIDHLHGGEFARLVLMVPGEADVFCADCTRSAGQTQQCWLLSSDTDLLIHDLGPNGSVLFFQDVTLATFPRRTVLKAREYHPRHIAQRLGLNTLAPLAFALTKEPRKSLQDLVQTAKSLDLSSPQYKDWLKEYAPLDPLAKANQTAVGKYRSRALSPQRSLLPDVNSTNLLGQCDVEKHKIYCHYTRPRLLDPRVSELVYQVGNAILPPKYSPGEVRCSDCLVYLPFLIDDPTRGSAWRLSADLRHLGYAILSSPMTGCSVIQEFERRGQRITGSAVPLFRYKSQEITQTCLELSAHISAFMVNSGDLHLKSSLHFWKLYGALYLCDRLSLTGERLATKREVLRLLQGGQGQLDWSQIHRTAQLQGVLYSLRMLGQFLGVVCSCSSFSDKQVLRAVTNVLDLLESMPSAATFFDPVPTDGEDAIPEDYLTAAIENFPTVGDDPEEVYVQKVNERRNRKRKNPKGQDDGRRNQPKPQAQFGGNMFDCLSDLADG